MGGRGGGGAKQQERGGRGRGFIRKPIEKNHLQLSFLSKRRFIGGMRSDRRGNKPEGKTKNTLEPGGCIQRARMFSVKTGRQKDDSRGEIGLLGDRGREPGECGDPATDQVKR